MKFPKWHFIFNLFFCRRILTDSLLLSATDQVCGARFHMSVVLYLPFSLFLSLFFFSLFLFTRHLLPCMERCTGLLCPG